MTDHFDHAAFAGDKNRDSEASSAPVAHIEPLPQGTPELAGPADKATPTHAAQPTPQSAPAQQPTPASETPAQSAPAPSNAPGVEMFPVEGRTGSDKDTGSNARLAWGARSDVGLVREHNEDSFLVHAPLFCVCDGMGGHAAGEIASAIAVRTIAEHAPATADDVLLGAAVELANAAVIEGAQKGVGKAGMGCTATCALIDNNRMAVAHVGDSRLYVLHAGTLVRVTHDHSFVEELVDAGEITADEARVHPSRSVITRALGSDPDMYADHFTLGVEKGDRIIICSDGLSSMVPDRTIEDLAVSSATPQQAVDNLVAEALAEGGHDNVTVMVIDITDDGQAELVRQRKRKSVALWLSVLAAVLLVFSALVWAYIQNSFYLGKSGDTVAIYQGVPSTFLGIKLSSVSETTSILVKDLPEATQASLVEGIPVASMDVAEQTVESYRDQINETKTKAAMAASNFKASTDTAATTSAAATSQATTDEKGGN